MLVVKLTGALRFLASK